MAQKKSAAALKARQELFIELVRAHGRLTDQLSGLLREQGLTEPQYNVLRILRGAGREGLPCGQISDRMITRLPDITRLVDRLEKDGLVRRERGEQDRRVIRVVLTAAGRRLLGRLDDPVLELHGEQFRGLSGREVTALVDLLRRSGAD